MSDYLVKKICDKFAKIEEVDHDVIVKSIIEFDSKKISNDNIVDLNLNLENYIINVIEIIDDIKKLIIKLEKTNCN
jgi:ribosome-associated translation inhibitor RaiA